MSRRARRHKPLCKLPRCPPQPPLGGKTRISSSGAKDYGAKSLRPAEQLEEALRHGGFSLFFQRNRLGRLAVLPSWPALACRESSGNPCRCNPGSSGERGLQPCPLCKTLPKRGSSNCQAEVRMRREVRICGAAAAPSQHSGMQPSGDRDCPSFARHQPSLPAHQELCIRINLPLHLLFAF